MVEEEEEEEGGGAGWIVSFADLMTLLFCAFVVLYGITPQGVGDAVKLVGVVSSIRESFIEIPEDIPEEEKPGPIHKGIAAFKHFKGEQSRSPVLQRRKQHLSVINVIDKDLQKVKDMAQMFSKQHVKAGNQGNQKSAPVRLIREEKGIRIRMMSTLLFKPGKYHIERDALSKMKKLGLLLKDLGRPLVIEGHTDSIPMEGGRISNWELSTLRASSIAKYWFREIDFPESFVTIAGYADKRPAYRNNTETGRKLNRRIEIKVVYDKDQ